MITKELLQKVEDDVFTSLKSKGVKRITVPAGFYFPDTEYLHVNKLISPFSVSGPRDYWVLGATVITTMDGLFATGIDQLINLMLSIKKPDDEVLYHYDTNTPEIIPAFLGDGKEYLLRFAYRWGFETGNRLNICTYENKLIAEREK